MIDIGEVHVYYSSPAIVERVVVRKDDHSFDVEIPNVRRLSRHVERGACPEVEIVVRGRLVEHPPGAPQ